MAVKVSGSDGVDQSQVTGATQLPVGTNAERPASPEAGMMRFNTDIGQVEMYNAAIGQWQGVNEFFAQIAATGGTVTDIIDGGDIYRVHTFTSSGTFEVTAGGGEVEYLVVAGGGSGGVTEGWSTGGGGAGGVIESNAALQAASYAINVGSGGNPGNGQNSSFDVIATAIGGGQGGGTDEAGNSGGSGGGGGGGGSFAGGSGTAGQGFDGAASTTNYAGGGGGAGGAGLGGTKPNGGDCIVSSITGTPTNYAGGGGGGIHSSQPIDNNGIGGCGIGGDGGNGRSGAQNDGTDGVANTGSGGGGGGRISGVATGSPGIGGSGIVIVRYRIG